MHRMPPAGEETELRSGNLALRVDGSGRLRIGWGEPDWLGPGTLVVPGGLEPTLTIASPHSVALDAGPSHAEILAPAGVDYAVLRLEARDALDGLSTGDFATPSFAWRFEPARRRPDGAPPGLRGFAHQYTEFAYPVFADADLAVWRLLPFRPPVVLPLGLAAPDGRTILVAPLDGFHEQVVVVPAGRDDLHAGVRIGWHGDLDHVDAGFATELAIICGDGPRECLERWGALLRTRSGIAAPERDSDALGTRLSYWTDNGSAYWYRTAPGHDVASGITAAVDDLEARGLPIGAVQLDSWWYPHEVLRPFDTDDWVVPPTGMTRWEPRPDVLPDGIPALRERLRRRPLVAHCRHLSSSSPYLESFPCWVDGDRAHPKTPQLYERLLDQARSWGVDTFEHDWLIECFLGVRGLRAAPGRAAAWQRGIDDALAARGMTAQWCMATPADFAHTTALRRVTSIRTSGDFGYLVGPEVLWAWFLHTNSFARALGLWPYKDVFHSAPDRDERDVEALLAAMSGGPVGIGDAIGVADPAIVRRTCRADGVLVRPDVPIAVTDACVRTPGVLGDGLLVASAHTDHATGRWGYALTLHVGPRDEPLAARVALPSLGDDRPAARNVAIYDWRRQTCAMVDAAQANDASYDVTLGRLDWDFRIIAPVLAGEIAVFGDPDLYASAGDRRLARVDVDGGAPRVVVTGAPGEDVRVCGWSASAIAIRASTPATGEAALTVERDDTGCWQTRVVLPATGWVRLTLR